MLDLPEAEWMDAARCATSDPEAWFPESGQPALPAKRICAKCPVREECLEFALTWDVEFGVWGGLSPHQRRAEAASRTALAA